MNGAQDLGGMMGFGPVAPEPQEPIFHAEWEKRALALTLAAGACRAWNIDMSRYARESLHPAFYLSKSYYEIWIAGLEKLLVSSGLVSETELGGAPVALGKSVPVLRAADVAQTLARGAPVDRPAATPPRFAAGEQVRTKVMNPPTHTRLPRYARGKLATVAAVRGYFVFPDANARGEGEAPHWCYSIRFSAQELWGAEADPTVSVNIEAWESYLEPALER
jgi:nitrile hydratase